MWQGSTLSTSGGHDLPRNNGGASTRQLLPGRDGGTRRAPSRNEGHRRLGLPRGRTQSTTAPDARSGSKSKAFRGVRPMRPGRYRGLATHPCAGSVPFRLPRSPASRALPAEGPGSATAPSSSPDDGNGTVNSRTKSFSHQAKRFSCGSVALDDGADPTPESVAIDCRAREGTAMTSQPPTADEIRAWPVTVDIQTAGRAWGPRPRSGIPTCEGRQLPGARTAAWTLSARHPGRRSPGPGDHRADRTFVPTGPVVRQSGRRPEGSGGDALIGGSIFYTIYCTMEISRHGASDQQHGWRRS